MLRLTAIAAAALALTGCSKSPEYPIYLLCKFDDPPPEQIVRITSDAIAVADVGVLQFDEICKVSNCKMELSEQQIKMQFEREDSDENVRVVTTSETTIDRNSGRYETYDNSIAYIDGVKESDSSFSRTGTCEATDEPKPVF